MLPYNLFFAHLMNRSSKLLLVVLLLAATLASCGKSAQATIFMVSQVESPGAKKIGCDEYLVPKVKELEGEATLENVMRALLGSKPSEFGADVLSATAFTDGYIQLDEVQEPPEPKNTDPFRVRLKTNPAAGLTGACDAPRIKEQITETIRAYTDTKGGAPFQITLNGKLRSWECLGDESGKCK